MSGQTDQSRPVSRVSVVEALTQIRALCDEADEHGTDTGVIDTLDLRAVLDAVSVDATPAQGIDRDALIDHAALIDRAVASLAHIVSNETAAWNVWNYIASPGPVRDAILALVRPVEGTVLTPEENEALVVASDVLKGYGHHGISEALRALASRLEVS